MPYSNGIMEVYLAINQTTYQSMTGREQIRLVLSELPLMLGILLVRWEIHSAEFRLDYETPLVRVHGKINFDWELDAVGAVDLFKYLFLISSKTYFTELLCLNNGGELNTSAPLGQDC